MTALPRLKARVKVTFPSKVEGTNGVEVVKENGEYTIGLDLSGLSETPPINSSTVDNYSMLTYDSVNGSYSALTIENLINGIGLDFDVSDAVFNIYDNSDETKKVQFQVSGVTTATTRTLTIPDADTRIVGNDTTDTLTNKTFDTAGAGNSLSINGVAVTENTGTGAVARAVSPSFTTPTLGAATATSINKVSITAPASSAALTIPEGVTLFGPAASGTAMTLGNAETVTGAKTWSGLQTHSDGGIHFTTTAPPYASTWFWGGGVPANYWVDAGTPVAASATVPEITAQFGIVSAVGGGNPTSAFKMALAAYARAQSGSAYAYAANFIIDAGSAYDKKGTGLEIDVNNNRGSNETFANIGTSNTTYGLEVISGGSYQPSAAIWITAAASVGFASGVAITGSSSIDSSDSTSAGFIDTSNGYSGVRIAGSKTYGIRLDGGTYANAAIYLPNDSPVAGKTTGSTVLPLIKVNAGDQVQIGGAGANPILMAGAIVSQGSAPTISGFGTGASISGNNTAGLLTVGTSAGGAGVITFNADHPYSSPPIVLFSGSNGGSNVSYTVSATAITVTAISDGGKYYYFVIGK